MNNLRLGILALTFLVIINSLFIVNETQIGLIFQFGEVVKTIEKPGLSMKIPFIQNLLFLDKRVLSFNSSEKEVIAKDQKRLIVSAYSKYKISDPIKFYQTVRDEEGAKSRLGSVLESSLRQVLAEVPLSSLLTTQRPEIMKKIQEIFSSKASRFGVDVIDVRISRADLPAENSQAIFKRMQTDREKEAKENRAEGEEQASMIRANADKDKVIILAEARKKAEYIKAAGDGTANEIYAKSFLKDPAFFEFYRSMSAYKNSLKNSKILISPDSSFMKYFDLKGN